MLCKQLRLGRLKSPSTQLLVQCRKVGRGKNRNVHRSCVCAPVIANERKRGMDGFGTMYIVLQINQPFTGKIFPGFLFSIKKLPKLKAGSPWI